MEIIAKISKGSKMDQIYIPKDRIGLSIGQYVTISPILNNISHNTFKPFFRGVSNLEPLKLAIIQQIFNIVDSMNPENIIITGSFLEKGFTFNDIDILLITEDKLNILKIKEKIENILKIKTHVIVISNKEFTLGLSMDPLYNMMISKCISRKRVIYKINRIIDYKYLDIQLLKSKLLIDNFDILNGNEKYYLIFNMAAIFSFIKGDKLNKENIEKLISQEFNVSITEIKENKLNKEKFTKKYKKIYNHIFNIILEGVNEQK